MYDTFKKFDLTGKTAFITGGGTGMGYFMTRGLVSLGAKVMIAARREDVLKDAVVKLKQETGREVLYTTIDLSDRANTIATAEKVIKALGGVDIFVGNAAQDGFCPINEINDTDVDRMFMVNVAANITLSRMFLPHMRSKKWGRIMFSSSITEKLVSAHEGMTTYGASKAAISSVARSLAVEAGHDGVTANTIMIGAVMTDMLQAAINSIPEEQRALLRDSIVSQNALGRFASPEEVEGIVQLLVSNAGSYISGASIPVEGGWSVTLKANPAAN